MGPCLELKWATGLLKRRRGEERRGWGGEREGIVFDGSEEVEDDYT